MKKIIFLFLINHYSFFINGQSGILVNPYLDHTQSSPSNPNHVSPEYKDKYIGSEQLIYTTWKNQTFNSGMYSGEYEVYAGDLFWFTDFSSNFFITYDIETVGFPFMMNCFDSPTLPPCANCSTTTRVLQMPDVSHSYSSDKWGAYLYRKTPIGLIDASTGFGQFSGGWHQTLVSRLFTSLSAPTPSSFRAFLPHSAHKINLYLHDGSCLGTPVISTLSFVYDNTRGRMRYYPFYSDNCPQGGSADLHDVILRPSLVVNTDNVNTTAEMYYDDSESNASWTEVTDGTINYYQFNEINNSGCTGLALPLYGDPFKTGTFFNFPFPSPASLFICYLCNNTGTTLAGYQDPVLPTLPLQYINQNQNFSITKHTYTIDQYIDLNIMNTGDKTIYNPSEVIVTTDDLFFPDEFVFKTIRGTFPTAAQVNADNIPENTGSPSLYTDFRLVPVTTDLTTENPNDATNFPLSSQATTKHLYASRYYLDNTGNTNTKLTIGNCVGLFDAAFDVKQGATMIFNDYTTIRGKEDHGNDHVYTRYKIQTLGGAVLRNYADNQYLQNGDITQPYALTYLAKNNIYAGKGVDPDTDVPQNDYIVQSGADVTLKATDLISLKDGFSAKAGSTFRAIPTTVNPPGTICPAPPQNRSMAHGNNKPKNKSGKAFAFGIIPNPSEGTFQLTCLMQKPSLQLYLLQMYLVKIYYMSK